MDWHGVVLLGLGALVTMGGYEIRRCVHVVRRACKSKKERMVNVFRDRVFPDPSDPAWEWDTAYSCFKNGAVTLSGGSHYTSLRFKDVEISRKLDVEDYYAAVTVAWGKRRHELSEQKIEEVLQDLP